MRQFPSSGSDALCPGTDPHRKLLQSSPSPAGASTVTSLAGGSSGGLSGLLAGTGISTSTLASVAASPAGSAAIKTIASFASTPTGASALSSISSVAGGSGGLGNIFTAVGAPQPWHACHVGAHDCLYRTLLMLPTICKYALDRPCSKVPTIYNSALDRTPGCSALILSGTCRWPQASRDPVGDWWIPVQT